MSLIVTAALIGTLYWSTWPGMVRVWLIDPNYSHGFAIPIVSVLIAFQLSRSQPGSLAAQVNAAEWITGAAICGFSISLHMVSWFLGNWFLDVVSLILLLSGALLIVGGRRAWRTYRFPVLFLIFMAPLPIAWYQPLALVMQQLAAGLSCFLLETFGVPAYLEGHMIHLPDYKLEVGAACSGLRQVTALVAGAVVIGYAVGRGPLLLSALTIGSLGIAIFANALRIVLTGVVMMLFGRAWAEGVYHKMEGLVVVAVAACLMLCFARLLVWLDDLRKKRSVGRVASDRVASEQGVSE